MDNIELEGKKVFFVYPHSVFQENLIQRLVNMEFEIYILKTHEYVKSVLDLYPDAVFFMNIDRGLSRPEWETFIRNLLGENQDVPVSIGILSYEFDRSLAELYLMELSLPCGYIQLKQQLGEATNIISKTLIANEVRGRRKFVRHQVSDLSPLQLNAVISGKVENGTGLDISSSGIAFSLENPDIELMKNTHLSDIQLTLSGRRTRVSGIVLGFRKDTESGPRIHVILFDNKVDSDTRGVIRTYVNKQLQIEMEKILNIT